MSVHENLKILRAHYGHKQSYVAGVIDRPQQTYSKYETGFRRLPQKLAAKLASFYGVTVEQLLGTLPPLGAAAQSESTAIQVLEKVTVIMEAQQAREEKVLLLLEAVLKPKKNKR